MRGPPGLPPTHSVLHRDRIWVGDIARIRTGEGWLYLAMLMDLHSRKIIGWATSRNPIRDIAIEALKMALQKRRPKPGLIRLNDHRGQYNSEAYQGSLDDRGASLHERLDSC